MTMMQMTNMPFMPSLCQPGAMPLMPMAQLMPVMMATMSIDAKPSQTVWRMAPAHGVDNDAFQNCCEMMQLMLRTGMPIVIQCGNLCLMGVGDTGAGASTMPMLSAMPAAICQLSFEMDDGAMCCRVRPGRDANTAMFDNACMLLDKMLRMGLPMTMTCNGVAVMCCTNK